jgi:alkanesulfonate monooxygenase SsuD/methylene tetrahydromethanopterin reductase-like flavin-dependent oxidoreductase (luciferase family)
MRKPIRFHVLLLPNVEWAELKRRAVVCEQLGLDVIGLADHFVDWTNPAVPWFESWTVLAAIAEATHSIRLTTLVTQIPLRNPAMLARQVLTLDHISGGRIEVGLGTGLTIDPAYAMTGLPNWTAGERVDRFAEYVELVNQLLSNETTTFAGQFYSAEGAVMNPRPVQSPRPPILVAAMAPRMMRLAAKHADIWNSLSFKGTVVEQLAEVAERCAVMDIICAEIGRNPAALQRSYTMFDANARHRGGAIGYFDSVNAFEDQAGSLIELGMRDIGLYYPLDPAQIPVFEQICADVLPRLRSA